jgi:hypothetical protein
MHGTPLTVVGPDVGEASSVVAVVFVVVVGGTTGCAGESSPGKGRGQVAEEVLGTT